MYLPPTTGMSNIVSSDQCTPVSLNRLAVSHTVTPYRDNTYRIWIQKYCLEELLQLDDILLACRKKSILSNF